MNIGHLLRRPAMLTLTLGLAAALALNAFVPAGSAQAVHPSETEDTFLTDRLEPGSRGEDGDKHKHKPRGFFLVGEAAQLIGIERSELLAQLESGKSIAEVAEAKGIAAAELIDHLTKERLAKIDAAVQTGKWTQEKADRIKEKLPEHIRTLVHSKDWKQGAADKEQGKQKKKRGGKNKPSLAPIES